MNEHQSTTSASIQQKQQQHIDVSYDMKYNIFTFSPQKSGQRAKKKYTASCLYRLNGFIHHFSYDFASF